MRKDTINRRYSVCYFGVEIHDFMKKKSVGSIIMTVRSDISKKQSGLLGNRGVTWRLIMIPVLLCVMLPIGANAAPFANFTGTPLNGTTPLGVTFTDLSTGTGITNWSWDFGDGNITNLTVSSNPFHIYTSAGLKSVNLSVTNASGSNAMLKSNYINVTASPITLFANFTGTPLSGTAPLGVTFTDLSTGIGITNWSWDFGDGNVTNLTVSSNPVHVYTSAGLKSVNLTVTNASGSNAMLKSNYIDVTAPPTTNKSTNVGVFRPSNGNWFLETNKTGIVVSGFAFHFGKTGDNPIVGDWYGAGVTNVGIFRPSNGNWFLENSRTGTVNKTFHFGTTGDIPIVGDWYGTGVTNVGIFRPSNGNWFLENSGTGTVNKTFHFGTSGDIPVVGDWNGAGRTDVGVFRPSTGGWFLETNKTGIVVSGFAFHFGKTGDIPIVGDWYGTGRTDVGVFRPSNGNWFLENSRTGTVNKTFHFGTTGDIPIVGDWYGTGNTDVGVFRPSNGNWYLENSKTGTVNKTFHFGTTNDTPVVGEWI